MKVLCELCIRYGVKTNIKEAKASPRKKGRRVVDLGDGDFQLCKACFEQVKTNKASEAEEARLRQID